MTWWIWLLLVVFMLAMLVIGALYVVIHAIRAVRTAGEMGAAVGERVAAFTQPVEETASNEPPSFTQPLRHSTERYSDAHAELLRRKAAKRQRHRRRWEVWRTFND